MIQSDIANLASLSSPKFIYVAFLLKLFSEFYSTVLTTDGTTGDKASNSKIERALATLIAFVPGREKRIYLWDLYTIEKAKNNPFTASIMVLGEAVEYLSAALEFEEHAVAMEL
jgi:hypothetical protein